MERLYTVDEVAAHLHLNVRTVRDMIKDGELIAKKLGRQYLIRESDLEKFIREHWEKED